MHFYGKEEKKIIQFWVGNRISGIEIDFSLENSPYLLKDWPMYVLCCTKCIIKSLGSLLYFKKIYQLTT